MGWLERDGTMLILTVCALTAGCERAPAVDANAGGECRAVRALGERSLKRWMDVMNKGPAPDAPLSAAAEHTESLAKTAREIGAEFTKAAPKRADLAEAAEGARMLGDLAGQKLDALARTVRALEAGLAPLSKLEGTANDAVEGMGKDIAGNVGCGAGAPPACAAVQARVRELDNVRTPPGFAEAAKAARGRAATLDELAKAVEALPAAPPKQKAREETTRHAREGASAFRALADALAAAAPAQERVGKDKQEAEEAAMRLTAELEAASKLCGAKEAPASSASAAPAASAKK
jgi:hypothetical protein